MRSIVRFTLAAAIITCSVVLAIAQSSSVAPPPSDVLNSGGILSQFLPVVSELALGILSLVAIYVARLVKARTGIDIEAKVKDIEANHRDALHSAIVTALGSAIAKFGLDKASFTPDSEFGKFLVRTVNGSVPEAVKMLNAADDWILKAAESKLTLGAPIAGSATLVVPAKI